MKKQKSKIMIENKKKKIIFDWNCSSDKIDNHF